MITEPFIATARAAAALAGLPDYPVVVIEHPLSRLERAEIRSRAETAAEAVVRRLVSSPAEAAP